MLLHGPMWIRVQLLAKLPTSLKLRRRFEYLEREPQALTPKAWNTRFRAVAFLAPKRSGNAQMAATGFLKRRRNQLDWVPFVGPTIPLVGRASRFGAEPQHSRG